MIAIGAARHPLLRALFRPQPHTTTITTTNVQAKEREFVELETRIAGRVVDGAQMEEYEDAARKLEFVINVIVERHRYAPCAAVAAVLLGAAPPPSLLLWVRATFALFS